jgi:hypothetical protein
MGKGMKYIVVRATPNCREEMFLFPASWIHKSFAEVIHQAYPKMEVVSAGEVANYPLDVESPKGTFDQIRIFGRSETLGVKSRPEDTELFHRLVNGM